MNKKIILWALVFVILLQGVISFGISPAKSLIISEDSSTYDPQFKILNTNKISLDAIIYVEGDVEKYIQLDQKKISLTEKDKGTLVNFHITLPEELPPGDTIGYIVVEQNLESKDKNVVSSKLLLKHRVIIRGPYPEKYVEAKVNFHETPTSIDLVSEIANLGTNDLESVQTNFFINGMEQEVYQRKTEDVPVSSKETKLLRASIDKKHVSYGEFEVTAVTTYDDLTMELRRTMVVGKPEVNITYFTPFFLANKVNEYSLDLENLWNRNLDNVFVDVEVKKDGTKIDHFRTKSVELDGLMSEVIKDYYDARKNNPGKYSFNMVVNFLQNYHMAKKEFNVELMTDEEFKKSSITGATVSDWSQKFNPTFAWSIVAFLLLAIVAYVGYRYIHRKNYESENGKII